LDMYGGTSHALGSAVGPLQGMGFTSVVHWYVGNQAGIHLSRLTVTDSKKSRYEVLVAKFWAAALDGVFAYSAFCGLIEGLLTGIAANFAGALGPSSTIRKLMAGFSGVWL
jgi:hypothetical protein